MKIPWRTRTDRQVAEPAPAPAETEPRVERHRSPGLQAVASYRGPLGSPAVLDLGPALPENVELLSTFASRIQVVDYFRDPNDAVPALQLLRGLDPGLRGTFDLVLFWDVFDYLTSEQGTALVELILPLCGPDARCLAMAWATDTVPAKSRRYRMVDGSHLVYEWISTDEVGITQMTPAALGRVLTGFSIEHAFVLRNGLREFVAIRDADSNGPASKA